MFRKILIYVLFICVVIINSVISVYKADFNYDILPYVASAYSFDVKDTNEVHRFTYETLNKTANVKEYNLLVKGNEFREAMFNCPACFYQQLPFYKVRPLYVGIIYMLYKFGINIAYSSVIISALSYFAICLIIFFWLKKIIKNEFFLLLISSLLAFSPFLLDAASESTPNALSGAILLLALFYLLNKNKIYPFLILMLISVFARPDNIILLVIFLSALLIYKRKKTKIITGTIVLGVITFLLIDNWAGNYPWLVSFEHAFKGWIIRPAEYEPHFSIGLYLKGLTKWAVLLKFSFISLIALFLSLTVYLKQIPMKEYIKDLDVVFLFAFGLSIIVHLLVFPAVNDKYFISQYIGVIILFITNIFYNKQTLANAEITH